MSKRAALGRAIEEGLREAVARKRGKIELMTHVVEPVPPARVKPIRKSAIKNMRHDEDTEFGRELIASVKEALAHSRGAIPLTTRVFKPTRRRG